LFRDGGRFQSTLNLPQSNDHTHFDLPNCEPLETINMTLPVFETIFAVPMTCQSCIDDIEGSLQQLSGTSAVG
jgi:hypothetical protein